MKRRISRVPGFLAAAVVAAILLLGGLCSLPQAQTATPTPPPAAPPSPDGLWAADILHTNVNFTVRHFGISLVRGRFDKFSGSLTVDSAHPDRSSVKFVLDGASIDTNVKMRDDDLRSANYFDVAKYPEISFASTRIEVLERPTADGSKYIAHGNLGMHGVTKEIALPFIVNGPIWDPHGTARFGLLTHVTLHRLDFGVGSSQLMRNGELAIGNDVDIDISLEAVPARK